MGLEQLFEQVGKNISEYTAGVRANWREYSSNVVKNVTRMVSDVESTVKLVPDLGRLRDAANQDIKDGSLDDFVYAEEETRFIFHPQEILPFNVVNDKVTYTLLCDITLEKGRKKFKTAKPAEVFFYNGRTVYEGTLVRKTGFFPIGKEYELVRTAAAKALDKMRDEYCIRLSDYLTERWRSL